MKENSTLSLELEKELLLLREMESDILSRSKNAMEGSLHITRKRGHTQYYNYTDKKERIYIRKKDIAIAENLAQKNYDQHLLVQIQNRIRHIELLIKDYDSSLVDHYLSLTDERKALIHPIISDDATFIRNWYEANPGMQNSYPYHNTYLTNRNEPVRSKSEKIIADIFDKHNIPYIYEPKILTMYGHPIIPDFLTLNVRLRKSFIYDHFGMMGNEEYANNTLQKLNRYSVNNYIYGENFLFSMESNECSLDTRFIERIVERYLE